MQFEDSLEEGKELFIVPTPIGNLADITLRALEVLGAVDVILAEDTRTTVKLLNRYEIKTRMLPYYAGGELRFDADRLFKEHSKAALVSESGTPCISDPGYLLVNYCHRNSIRITALPGPCAAVTLLSASGFPIQNTLFYGFLPNKKGKRRNVLANLLANEKKTIVFYESPWRVSHFFEIAAEIDPELEIVCGRELTKKFEEICKKKVKEFLEFPDLIKIGRGEFTIIVNNRTSAADEILPE